MRAYLLACVQRSVALTEKCIIFWRKICKLWFQGTKAWEKYSIIRWANTAIQGIICKCCDTTSDIVNMVGYFRPTCNCHGWTNRNQNIEEGSTICRPFKLNFGIHLILSFSPFFTNRVFIRPSTATRQPGYHNNQYTKTGSMRRNNEKTLYRRSWKILFE